VKALACAREFLQSKLKVPFLAVHVDSTTFDYDKKISTEGVPAVFIFDRDNRWVQRLPSFDDKGNVKDEVDYDLIEQTVAHTLKERRQIMAETSSGGTIGTGGFTSPPGNDKWSDALGTIAQRIVHFDRRRRHPRNRNVGLMGTTMFVRSAERQCRD
jgi:hypothetical protein